MTGEACSATRSLPRAESSPLGCDCWWRGDGDQVTRHACLEARKHRERDGGGCGQKTDGYRPGVPRLAVRLGLFDSRIRSPPGLLDRALPRRLEGVAVAVRPADRDLVRDLLRWPGPTFSEALPRNLLGCLGIPGSRLVPLTESARRTGRHCLRRSATRMHLQKSCAENKRK